MQHLQPGTLLQGGRYRIESLIGGGGFGNTYVATNTAFGDYVAIKEFFIKGVTEHTHSQSISVSNAENLNIFHQQKEKFRKEALRLRSLNNPYIVRVHDLFEENNTIYYVMDYIDGDSLSLRMKRLGRPFTEQEVRKMLPQMLIALKYVHESELWHLDLKPSNIMVDKKGDIRLIDFGASKQLDKATGGATAISKQQTTEGFAPPEQLEENFNKYGPWTDIYGLGATLYALLTKKHPPKASDLSEDTTPDKSNVLPFPPDVSEEMRKAVVWMMNTNRAMRPQSVDELIEYFSFGKEEKEEVRSRRQEATESDATQLKSQAGRKPDQSERTAYSYNAPTERPHLAHSNTESYIQHRDTYYQKEDDNTKKWVVIILIIIIFSFLAGIGIHNATRHNTYYLPADTDTILIDTVAVDTLAVDTLVDYAYEEPVSKPTPRTHRASSSSYSSSSSSSHRASSPSVPSRRDYSRSDNGYSSSDDDYIIEEDSRDSW